MQVSFNKPADYQSVYRGQTDRSIETTDKNPESTAVTLNEIKKKILKTEFMGFCFSVWKIVRTLEVRAELIVCGVCL